MVIPKSHPVAHRKWKILPLRQVACIKCAYLSIDKDELPQSWRIPLHSRNQATSFTKNALESIVCFRGISWESNLVYCGLVMDAFFDEILNSRTCRYYVPHVPGVSPQQQMERSEKRQEKLWGLVFSPGPLVSHVIEWIVKLLLSLFSK